MANVNFSITGIKQAMENMKALSKEFPDEFAVALYQEGELLMSASKKEIPVDTGSARDSGYVEEPKTEFGNVSVTLGYGGVATKINPDTGQPTDTYLVYLHENMKARHKVGKAKFLEDPAKALAPDLERKIRARVKKVCDKKRAV